MAPRPLQRDSVTVHSEYSICSVCFRIHLHVLFLFLFLRASIAHISSMKATRMSSPKTCCYSGGQATPASAC
jgi:hypothetical protein